MNLSELDYFVVGVIVIYSVIHFFVIQHSKTWEQRSGYQKTITILAMIFVGLIFLGIAAE